MKKSVFTFLLGMMIWSAGTWLLAGPKNSPGQFSSEYTDLDLDCQTTTEESEENFGEDPTVTCKGLADYIVSVSYSAWGAAILIEGPDGFSVTFPEQGENILKGKLEWRLKDGKPFAAILRINSYETEEEDWESSPFQEKNIVGEFLVVKGLAGFEHIDGQIDVAASKNPNLAARQLADKAAAP